MMRNFWGRRLEYPLETGWPLVFLATLLCLGCGGSKPPPQCERPEIVELTLAPEPRLNPDREGNPRSVVIRVFQLNGADAFYQGSFQSLWASANPSGPLLAAPDEYTLIPGKQEVLRIARHPKATHLGLAANFREQVSDNSWRVAIELPAPQNPCESEEEDPIAAHPVVRLMEYTMRLWRSQGEQP
ncbi:MAG: type VI secretion system lipoprotein TssJ [Myxococcales bacterium]